MFPFAWTGLYIGSVTERSTDGIRKLNYTIAMGYASHLAVQAYDRPFQMTSDLSVHLSMTCSFAHDIRSSLASEGIALYYAQLALNVLWTPLFFVKKQVCLQLACLILHYALTSMYF